MLTMNNDSPGAAATINATDKEGVTVKLPSVPVWASDNTAVATVTAAADGMSALVKPVANGTCNITCHAEGDPTAGVDPLDATAPVTIVDPEASQISISFGPPQ